MRPRNVPTYPDEDTNEAVVIGILAMGGFPLRENTAEHRCFTGVQKQMLEDTVEQPGEKWYMLPPGSSVFHYRIYCDKAIQAITTAVSATALMFVANSF